MYQLGHRFLPGKSGNPAGRPKSAFKDNFDQLQAKQQMADIGTQIYRENYEEIILAMCNQAIKGNVQAAVYLRDSLIGRPKETVGIENTDNKAFTVTITAQESKL